MAIADDVIKFALSQVGKPYRWGATGPDSYDCSGLIYAAYKAAGKPFRFRVTTGTLRAMGTSVTRANLQPGDLVFPDAGHVQIYLGGGKVVEAPHTGSNVRVVNMWGFAYARRIVAPAGANYSGGADNALDIPNPLDAVSDIAKEVKQLYSVVQSFQRAAAWLSTPQNWLRIGMLVVGTILMFVALIGAERTLTAVQTTAKGAAHAAT